MTPSPTPGVHDLLDDVAGRALDGTQVRLDARAAVAEAGRRRGVQVRRRAAGALTAVAAAVVALVVVLPTLGAPAPRPAGPPPTTTRAAVPTSFAVDAARAPRLVEDGKVRSRQLSAVFVGTDGVPAGVDAATGRVLRLPLDEDGSTDRPDDGAWPGVAVSPDGTVAAVWVQTTALLVVTELRTGVVRLEQVDDPAVTGPWAVLDPQAITPQVPGGRVGLLVQGADGLRFATVTGTSGDGRVDRLDLEAALVTDPVLGSPRAVGGSVAVLPGQATNGITVPVRSAAFELFVSEGPGVSTADLGALGAGPGGGTAARADDGSWWRVAGVPGSAEGLWLERRDRPGDAAWTRGPALAGTASGWSVGLQVLAVRGGSAVVGPADGQVGGPLALWTVDLRSGRLRTLATGAVGQPVELAAQVVGSARSVTAPGAPWWDRVVAALPASPLGMPPVPAGLVALVLLGMGWTSVRGWRRAWREAGSPRAALVRVAAVLAVGAFGVTVATVGATVGRPGGRVEAPMVDLGAASRVAVRDDLAGAATAPSAVDARGGVRAQRLSLAAVVAGRPVGVDATSGAVVALPAGDSLPGATPAVRLAPDGRLALVVTVGAADGVRGTLTDLASGQVRTLSLDGAGAAPDAVARRLALLDDGGLVEVTADGSDVRRRDTVTGAVTWERRLPPGLTGPVVSGLPDSVLVVGAGSAPSEGAAAVLVDPEDGATRGVTGAAAGRGTLPAAAGDGRTTWVGSSLDVSRPAGQGVSPVPALGRVSAGTGDGRWVRVPLPGLGCQGCSAGAGETLDPVAVVGPRVAVVDASVSPTPGVDLVDPADGSFRPWLRFETPVTSLVLAQAAVAGADDVRVAHDAFLATVLRSRWTVLVALLLTLGAVHLVRPRPPRD